MSTNNYLYHYYPLPYLDKLETEFSIRETKDLMDFIVYGEKSQRLNKYRFSLKEQPFLNLKRLKSIMIDRKIWASRIDSFNDPLEFIGYFCPEMLLERYCSQSRQLLEDEQQKLLDDCKPYNGWLPFRLFEGKTYYGVYCFTMNPKCPLMWGYYASNHAGVCIRFKANEQVNKLINGDSKVTIVKYTDGPGLILGKITYLPEPFKLNLESEKYYRNEYVKIRPTFAEFEFSFEDYIMVMITLTKFEKWRHEDEFRLISLGLDGDISLQKLVDPNSHIPYFYPDALIFGCKTPKFIKQAIVKLLGNSISYHDLIVEHGTYAYKIQEFK